MEKLELFLKSYTLVATISKVLVVVLASVGAYLAAKWLVQRVLHHVIEGTETKWDDIMLEHGVFRRIYRLAPALVWYYGMKLFPTVAWHAHRLVFLYVLYGVLSLLDRMLDAGQEIHENRPAAEAFPIKGYVQSMRLFLYFIGVLVALAILLDRSLLTLLSGIGALTAVLLLVFRDTILSIIASLQISSHDVFRVGDWIEMPQCGADGTVIDIALHKVKIQNWDKTIVAVPTFKFIDESFKNWRGMNEAGGRRIKRALYLDQSSVKFVDDAMLTRLMEIDILREILQIRREEIRASNEALKIQGSSPLNGRCLTNIGVFRFYVRAYLEHHPSIHKGMPLLVRHLAPSAQGIGMEIYAFAAGTAWSHYESLQADIFDHLLAALPTFDLHVFQRPTGHDFDSIEMQ